MQVRYERNIMNFSKIPGSPIAYWVSNNFYNNYNYRRFSDFSDVITGMTIGDNAKYLRLWHEIGVEKISFNKKEIKDVDMINQYWIPYSKGGGRKNWYGINEYVVNWKMKNNFNRPKTTLQHLYLREAISWPFITCGSISAKLLPSGYLWDVAGSPCFFQNEKNKYVFLAFLCSNTADYILKVVNPTINVQAIDISQLPIQEFNCYEDIIEIRSKENVKLAIKDWDSFETSWDFKKHPLI